MRPILSFKNMQELADNTTEEAFSATLVRPRRCPRVLGVTPALPFY